MANLRQLETDLAQNIEDKIQQQLGYREHRVIIGDYELNPRPPVTEVDSANFTEQLIGKLFQITAGGLPSTVYRIEVSRNVPEDIIRSGELWTIIRDTIRSQCKLVSLTIKAARYVAIVAVIKNQIEVEEV